MGIEYAKKRLCALGYIFLFDVIQYKQMLKIAHVPYYKVKQGQTLAQIAEAFSLSPYLLAKENGLTEPLFVGQILKIPDQKGHRYVVQAGDSKELLCGSAENYRVKNGTDVFYIGMEVLI